MLCCVVWCGGVTCSEMECCAGNPSSILPCHVIADMETTVKATVARTETPHADELASFHQVSFKNVLGDCLVEDVKCRRCCPIVDNGELARNSRAAAALAVSVAHEGFSFRLILMDPKHNRVSDQQASREMLCPCGLPFAGDFLAKVLCALHQRVFQRHRWNVNDSGFPVVVLVLAPVAGVVVAG